jgi:ankyrin repeat protein
MNPSFLNREYLSKALLHLALGTDNDLIKEVIKKGADVTYIGKKGRTAINSAVNGGDFEIIKTLTSHGALKLINHIDELKKTLLHYAAYHTIEIIEFLLDNGINKEFINYTDKAGYTPLLYAVFNDKGHRREVIEYFISKGASETVRYQNNAGHTPLMCAILLNDTELVKLLLKYGAAKTINNAEIKSGHTALHFAASTNNLEILELLLQYGAEGIVNNINDLGETALLHATRMNNLPMVELLLRHGAAESINSFFFKFGITTLRWAEGHNNINMAKLLLENGAAESINIADDASVTPLLNAALKNNLDMVKLLIKYDIKNSINIASKDGFNVIRAATCNDNYEMLKYLINAGVSLDTINHKNRDGHTALFYALYRTNISIIKLLIENGAAPIEGRENINFPGNSSELLSIQEYIDNLLDVKVSTFLEINDDLKSMVINRISVKLKYVIEDTLLNHFNVSIQERTSAKFQAIEEKITCLRNNMKEGVLSNELYEQIVKNCPAIVEYSTLEMGRFLLIAKNFDNCLHLPKDIIMTLLDFLSPTGYIPQPILDEMDEYSYMKDSLQASLLTSPGPKELEAIVEVNGEINHYTEY